MDKGKQAVTVYDRYGAQRSVPAARARDLIARGSHFEENPLERQDEGETAVFDQYDDMAFEDLKAAAKEHDLSAGGSAEDIRARLREYDAAR